MEITDNVTRYAVIIALLGFALAFVAVRSRRELRMRLVALLLAAVMIPVAWFAFAQLPGTPKTMSADEFRGGYRCAAVLSTDIRERIGILMLVQRRGITAPEYILVSWNMRLASSLQHSLRVARENGAGKILYGGRMCAGKGMMRDAEAPPARLPGTSGEEHSGGDDFVFYPDPVTPMPEKNYGPLYEGLIVMPEK